MAAVCGRFHYTPTEYNALTLDEVTALYDLMLEEAKRR